MSNGATVGSAARRQGNKAEAVAAIDRAQRLDGQGLAAKYAQMVLSGAAADTAKFQTLVRRAFAAQRGSASTAILYALHKRGL